MEPQDDQEHLVHKANEEKVDPVDFLVLLVKTDEKDHED